MFNCWQIIARRGVTCGSGGRNSSTRSNLRRHGILLLLVSVLLSACSSIDLPTVEESQRRIAQRSRDIAAAETPLDAYARRFESGSDGVVTLRTEVVNRLFGTLASSRSDDVRVSFPPTRPLLQERKSIFGIQYTNRLDIDSGTVQLNLRRAELLPARGNVLRLLLEMEGAGRIAVSGKYTGIGATSSPRIQLSMRDTVSFAVEAGKDGGLMLIPQRGDLLLEATLHVNLLGWEVPWREDIPLRVEDLLTPIALPALFTSEIKIPVPADTYGDRNYKFAAHPVEFRDTRILLRGEQLTWLFDCVFR